MPINILIVGQGAIGLLWYHHIQTLKNSNAQHDEINLHLMSSSQAHSADAQYSFINNVGQQITGKVNFAQSQQIYDADYILLCVKSFQVSAALNQITNKLNINAAIVLAHNGMGTINEISDAVISRHNIYALLTTHGCLRNSPLTITHTGVGSSDLGLISGKTDHNQQKTLTHILSAALPDVLHHENIKLKQWLKLAINCVINPLTAINDINNGEVNDKIFLPMKKRILAEVVNVAKFSDINLSLDELMQRVERVAQLTAKNSSSMRCDILAKRKSEIDYINGYIHQLGIKYDIATPENSKLWQAVKNLETKVGTL